MVARARTSLVPPRLASLPRERSQLEYSSRSIVFARDGRRLVRTWGSPERPWVLAVEPAGARWRVEAWGAGPKKAREAARALFSLSDPLEEFYRHTRADPVLRGTERAFRGLRLPRDASLYESLLHAIVGQQLSVAAASAIKRRLFERLGTPLTVDGLEVPRVPAPSRVLEAGEGELRALGMSGAKSRALRRDRGLGLREAAEREGAPTTVARRRREARSNGSPGSGAGRPRTRSCEERAAGTSSWRATSGSGSLWSGTASCRARRPRRRRARGGSSGIQAGEATRRSTSGGSSWPISSRPRPVDQDAPVDPASGNASIVQVDRPALAQNALLQNELAHPDGAGRGRGAGSRSTRAPSGGPRASGPGTTSGGGRTLRGEPRPSLPRPSAPVGRAPSTLLGPT